LYAWRVGLVVSKTDYAPPGSALSRLRAEQLSRLEDVVVDPYPDDHRRAKTWVGRS
jgi:hypothetical protein